MRGFELPVTPRCLLARPPYERSRGWSALGPRKRTGTIGVLILSALLTACSTPAQDSSTNTVYSRNEGPRFLTGDELRSLLSDSTVSPVTIPNVIDSDPAGEIFLADGVCQRIISRSRLSGRYYVADTSVCVTLRDAEPHCRRMISNADGTYVFVDSAGVRSEPMVIRPYR